jgi:large subunit ribosomal protein L23
MVKSKEKAEEKTKAKKPAKEIKAKKAKAKIAINPTHYATIVAPIITEKSTMAGEHGKYIFKVAVGSNKSKVKEAVEALFDVEVTKINVINYEGKVKRFKTFSGRRNAFKKAIVTLKEGQSLDLASGFKA